MSVSHQIYEIINSVDFKKQLEKINSNYSNLKQEGVIRNAVLEQFNDFYANENVRAFAEHPRMNNTRVDLSIVNRGLPDPYKIECKHHYSNHDKCFANYGKRIQKEFNDRGSDMFILIVQTFDSSAKQKFDDSWDISTNISKYQSKVEDWKTNLKTCFNNFLNISSTSELLEVVTIDVTIPYPSKYHFYILKRKD